MPDIYQGNEIWDFSLVDPDNRRPVDYEQRREMLDGLREATPEELAANWPDGRIKMFLTQRLLQFRREHADLFQHGELFAAAASGTFAESLRGFARKLQDQWLIVIAPRLSSRRRFSRRSANVERYDGRCSAVVGGITRAGAFHRTRMADSSLIRLRLSEALSVLPFSAITNIR